MYVKQCESAKDLMHQSSAHTGLKLVLGVLDKCVRVFVSVDDAHTSKITHCVDCHECLRPSAELNMLFNL